ncbi:proline--tRNA ligase [Enterobacteriaceae endosymbiont of Donacia tomentosa]|uniref:proline--tRNA ligase n=1 Tax=Enterobacteriaceae endosymbiont of Donacia tomentosa TaxID=2675787 RepID=UPI001448F5E6|nr:proline--tRNA ligase [Enterobacteriaceae endosymbiont of Donacia tomentosa]QJC31658.1 proline--tRNA ligase [Enterobacteriaceae endosymbiont of Donacia tomentosa]
MLTTKYLFFTSKNKIYQKNINSYSLMIKSGIIKRLSSGIYTWLPTGLKIINNFKKIIRHEMNNIDAIELLMPILQPIHIWTKSGRVNDYGAELLKILDRRKNNFILGPTHEEVITHLMNNEIKSYKSLPIHLYQIQTKFRDEIRPRLGVIRSKEFIMKDSYSFHITKESLEETYNVVFNTYKKIFNLINIDYLIVKANNNVIGGDISHEFHILSKNGENSIALSEDKKYITNIELTKYSLPKKEHINKNFFFKKKLVKFKNCSEYKILSEKFNISIKNIVKTAIVETIDEKYPFIILLLRADYEFNINKIKKINKNITRILSKKNIENLFNINILSLGPFNQKIPIIGDFSIINMYNFTIGANIKDKYYINTNWDKDLPIPENIQDIRYVTKNDITRDKKEKISIKNSIEVAHIFQLGTKYSKLMNNYIYNKDKIRKPLHMGCYGIGISRLIAAIIEQNYDSKGICWPNSFLAPFLIAIIPINMYKYSLVKKYSYLLYERFKTLGIKILLDDRRISPGVMFADMDLIGIPYNIIINNNNIMNNNVEYKCRKTGLKNIIPVKLIFNYILKKIQLNNCFNIFYPKK